MPHITPHLGLPLPSPDSPSQRVDIERIQTALTEVDAALAGMAQETANLGAQQANLGAQQADLGAQQQDMAQQLETRALSDLSNVPNSVFGQKMVAAGGGSATVRQTAPIYMVSGVPVTIEGQSVLSVSEQIAGQTFALQYNSEADYAQENAATGTDHGAGAFRLHNTTGGEIDNATKLLIHADGPDGSTEIIDARGITPFGTHCAYFDGNQSFTVPASYKTAFGTSQNFTIECWVNPTSTPMNWGRIFILGDLFLSYHTAVGSAGGFVMSDGVNTGPCASNPDAWCHTAIVRNGSRLTLYVNGTERSSFPTSLTLGATPLSIGGAAEAFYGWIDELRVSKVARYTGNFTPHTSPHVRDADTVYLFHFDDGHGSQFIRDDSRSGHETALLGKAALSTYSAKFGTSSAFFPGTADGSAVRIACSKPHADFALGADDFTIDCWFHSTTTSHTQTVWYLGTSSYAPQILLRPDGTYGMSLSTNGTSWNIDGNNAGFGSWSTNTWTHLAVTRSGSNLYVFANGGLIKTYSVGSSSITSNNGNPSVLIGVDTSLAVGSALVGFVDEFRMKRGVAEWTANFTPPTAPYTTDDRTVLLLHFDGTNGDKVTLDSSESSYGNTATGESIIPMLVMNGTAALVAVSVNGSPTSMSFSTANYASYSFPFSNIAPFHPTQWEHFCFEGWFSLSTLSFDCVLFGVSGINGSWGWHVHGTGTGLEACVYNIQTNNVFFLPSVTVSKDTSVHVAFVRESRGYVLYVNGRATASPLRHIDLFFGTSPTGIILKIGGTPIDGSLSGSVGQFRVTRGKPRYTANFTPAPLVSDDDTALLWTFSGTVGQKWAKELSKNSTLVAANNARTVKDGIWIPPGTNNPTVSNTQSKFGIGSLYLPGSPYGMDTYPQSVDGSTGNWVFDCFVRPDPSYTQFSRMFVDVYGGAGDTWAITGGGVQWSAGINSNNNLYIRLATNDNSGAYYTAPSTVSLTQAWHHFAVVRSGSSIYMYWDGNRVNNISNVTIPTVTGGKLRMAIGASGGRSNCWYGWMDEIRYSYGTDRGWTADTIPVPTLPYGEQYVPGPSWVATKPGVSALDLSAFSSIDNASAALSLPPGTSIRFLVSTDNYGSPLKRWNGSAWVSTAYNMTWNGTALTTPASAAQLNVVGNTWPEIQAGLLGMNVSGVTSFNIVAVLSTANTTFTPVLDAITVTMDEYTLINPVLDYTIKRKQASGNQPLTITRVKPGNALHIIDYI